MVAFLAPADGTDSTILQIARQYVACGFSVVPLDPSPDRKKNDNFRKRPHPLFLPGRKWGTYQLRLPTDGELVQWFTSTVRGGTPGIAIINGPTSGGLVTLDFDNGLFCQWLEAGFTDTILKKTWVVRSGGGYIHVKIKSRTPVYNRDFIAGGGKVGDILAWGQGDAEGKYAVAPPTIHPNNVPYVTLYGGPESIAEVEDANLLIQKLADLYSGHATGVRRLSSTTKTILPPVEATEVQRLVEKLSTLMNQKVKRAILNGAEPLVGEWTKEEDNSDIDFWVIATLLEDLWTQDEIKAVYRSLPIGELTYRNTSRGNHGESYFEVTWANVAEKIKRQEAAGKQAAGVNFTVTRAIHQDFDGDPIYVLSLQWTDGTGTVVKLNKTEFDSDRSFRNTVWAQTRRVPDFQANQMGTAFFNFKGAVGAMASVEEAPEDATTFGHLKSVVMRTLRNELRDHTPDDADQFSLGWCEQQAPFAFVRGPVLIARVQALIHQARPDHIWRVLRGLGGRTAEVQIGQSREQVWTLPAGKLR